MIIYENCRKNYYSHNFAIFIDHPIKKAGSFKFKPKSNILMLKDALEYIKSGKAHFQELNCCDLYPTLHSKFILLECKIKCHQWKAMEIVWSESFYEEMKKVCLIMKEKNLNYLEIVSLISIAEYAIKSYL